MVQTNLKGIKVLSKDYPDMFQRILGYDKYLPKIIAANGDAKRLKKIFWNDLADDYHWEFINGEIILRAGMTFYGAGVGQNLQIAIWKYLKERDSGEVLSSRCITCFPENDYSPYIMYFRKAVADGFTGNQNKFPIPDWIVEVNDENTEENNRGVKFKDYEKQGVNEYWMVNLEDKSIEQYLLDKEGFDFLGKFTEGMIASKTLAGFEISLKDIFQAE